VQSPAVDLAASDAAGEVTRSMQPREPRTIKPREYKPRGDVSDQRPARKSFSKPGTFGRKREGPAARPTFDGPRAPGSYTPRPSGGPGYSGKPGYSKSGGFPKSKNKYSSKQFVNRKLAHKPKDKGEQNSKSESGKRVYRKFDAPRERPARPFSTDRPTPPDFSDRPVRPARTEGTSKPTGDYKPRTFTGKPGSFAGKKPFGKSAGKPGGFSGKKPFGKPGAAFPGKPSSTFAKFAGNKKPFGKRPPARKFKPKEDESAG
jgi:hypothetical protein